MNDIEMTSDNINKYIHDETDTKKSFLRLLFLIIGVGIIFCGINISLYFDKLVFPEYLNQLYGENQAFVINVVLSGINTLFYLGTLIVAGTYSDNLRTRFGNRLPIVLFGALLAGASLIAGMFTSSINFPLFIFLIIYIGKAIGFGCIFAPSQALISELFTKDERSWAAMGLTFIGGAGTAIGIAMQAVEGTNYLSMMIIIGVIIIILAIVMFILTPKKNPPFPPENRVLQDILDTPRYLLAIGSAASRQSSNSFLIMFLVQMCWGSAVFIISANFTLFIQTLTDHNYQIIITANEGLVILMAAAAVFALPAGKLMHIIGKTKSAMIGSLLVAIATFIGSISSFWNFYGLTLILILAGFGFIIISTVSVALPADLVPKGKEGQFMGLFILATNLSTPIAAGAVTILGILTPNKLLAYSTLFLITSTLELIALGLLTFIHYEDVIDSEYKEFYYRYLIYKGLIQKRITKISSSFNTISRKFKK